MPGSLLLRSARLRLLLILPLLFALSSCSAGYYTSAGYNQVRLLLSRRSIEGSLLYDTHEPEMKEKLELTLAAREFAKEIGLDPKETFLTYSTLNDLPTIWVLTAAEKFRLEPYTWRFPVVGALPYKGYFNQAAAEKEKKSLEKKGYDVSMRTTAAYSTLGWFNDPVMPSTLRLDNMSLFNTVVHEITHTTLWIPGHANFNETMAQTVGYLATAEYWSAQDPVKGEEARWELYRECRYAEAFEETRLALTTLFESETDDTAKEAGKEMIYTDLAERLASISRSRSGEEKEAKGAEKKQEEVARNGGSSRTRLNNASFLAYHTYLDRFQTFLSVFLQESSIQNYLNALDELTLSGKIDEPFVALLNYEAAQAKGKVPDLEAERDRNTTGHDDICEAVRESFRDRVQFGPEAGAQ